MKKNIILTGLPHSGKSTLLLNLLDKIQFRENALITKEILEGSVRAGFKMCTPLPFDSVNSTSSVIAHIAFPKKTQVGKYGVNIDQIDFWANKYIYQLEKVNRGYIAGVNFLDEVGQMQLFSEAFEILVQKILYDYRISIMTLSSIYNNSFTDVIRKRRDIILLEVTPENRDELLLFVPILIKKIQKARNYILHPNRFKKFDNQIEMKSDHGNRIIDLINKTCNCDFYNQYINYKICSHILACEEFYSL